MTNGVQSLLLIVPWRISGVRIVWMVRNNLHIQAADKSPTIVPSEEQKRIQHARHCLVIFVLSNSYYNIYGVC